MGLHRRSLAVFAAGATLLACSDPVETGAATSPLACEHSPVADAPYVTVAQLDALLTGLWARCDGHPQLEGEELGIELTDGHLVYPLQRGPGDSAVRVAPAPGVGPESWTVLSDDKDAPRLLFMWPSSTSKDRSSFVVDGTTFAGGGQQMFLPYTPAGATYVRLQGSSAQSTH